MPQSAAANGETMTQQPTQTISDEHRATYARDGVVCLRGVYSAEALDRLLRSWDEVVANPHAVGLLTAEEERRQGAAGAHVISRPSSRVAAFRRFLWESSVPELLGALLGARRIGFYWDTIFAKDAGTRGSTPWHHDAGATAVRGNQLVNVWTPLTPTSPDSGVECIAGSHRWGVLYWPRSPNGSRLSPPPGRPWCPDFEERRDDPSLTFLGWTMEPGDVLVLHPRTAHFSCGNRTRQRRVAYATWWYGDDVVWDPRPECEVGHPEVPFAAMPGGERPNHPLFPIRWMAPGEEAGGLR
ncbi:MAG: hypothetical protein EXQ85_09925 [Alphaproteobacteria bacterium]|nr:hypothetical protein [Alphaproteobacteria bacterium]